MVEQRINSEVLTKVPCEIHAGKTHWVVCPSKGNKGTTRGKEKIF